MRGREPKQISMLCLMNLEDQIPKDHPLREVKALADRSLRAMSRAFSAMYSKRGRPSVPPERLLKGMVLMALYSIRSERRFVEELRYNLLYRWFLDMDMVEVPFDHCAFSDNRERLMKHEVAQKFFALVFAQAEEADLTSSEHFSVDGTLIEAWSSMKSFRRKDDDDDGDSNGWSGFRGSKRSNETHESKTDPEARLMRKGRGKEAKLAFAGHALMENRNGLIVDFRITEANGHCEVDAALDMLASSVWSSHATVGADKGYDTKRFVAEARARGVTPHVAQYEKGAGQRGSAIDRRTTRHPGYQASQRVRKRVEQVFGWLKSVATLRRTRFRGIRRTATFAYMAVAAYNLLRTANLVRQPA